MSAPKQIPDETVAMIKAIFHLDHRERQKAGYKLGTFNLALRIAEAYGLKKGTVVKIKKGYKRRHVAASRSLEKVPAPRERLERIRQKRIAQGAISEAYSAPNPQRSGGHWTYKKRMGYLGTRS